MELLQALFRLSEAGHYESVSNLFVPPSKNCADVLLLSMLQARVSFPLSGIRFSVFLPLCLVARTRAVIKSVVRCTIVCITTFLAPITNQIALCWCFWAYILRLTCLCAFLWLFPKCVPICLHNWQGCHVKYVHLSVHVISSLCNGARCRKTFSSSWFLFSSTSMRILQSS